MGTLWDSQPESVPMVRTLPAIRVDNEVIWPGGYARKMTLRERLAWRFGRRTIRR